MKLNSKLHISMDDEEVKNALIKFLYDDKGISGIFDVKFKLRKRQIPSHHPQDCDYVTEFDGAEITVDLNEK